MNRPKYKSKLRRNTIIEEKNRSKLLNEHIKYSLKIKNKLSDVNRAKLNAAYEIENKQDQLSKVDDNDDLNRNFDHLKWREREYNRLKREYLDYIGNCKSNRTLDYIFQ
ncbi:uncharacterized protein cubi_02286 [Cryptosporidium ubiquitum]|uniref:Micro-fibrillar-associated protein 1 C-terminal domain-containing protein n=1 Tax=Cryptosporidium ubiquitum TaxID=857276 RepID=A0A1J4MGB3_9CRYT|nr:uncharacterized protein cubi_02286 [Cryptosporidium ubiquitum]OII73055.1 hypothetical protein cubi_02286 [Cryptosporidium ubiquitum]